MSSVDSWLVNARQEQIKASSPGGQLVTQVNDKRMSDQNKFAKEKSNELFTQNKMLAENIKRDDYNFEEMYKEQGAFNGTGESIMLPNKFRAPLKQDVAGYDMGTGRQERKVYEDGDGIGRKAVDLLRTSYADSKEGPPVEDVYPLSQVAYLAQREGKTEDEYRKSLGGYGAHASPIMQQSWILGQRLKEVEDYQAYLEAGKFEEDETAPSRKLPVQIKHDDLPDNQVWINSSRAFFEELYGPAKDGVTPDDINKSAIEFMGHWNNNLTSQAVFNSRIKALSDNGKKAFYNMMVTYDNIDLEGVRMEYFGRAAGAIASDPLTYAGAAIGTAAYKKLMAQKIGAKAFSPILASSIASVPEGYFYGGFQEYNKQVIEREGEGRKQVDMGTVADKAASSAALTAGGTTVIGLGLKAGGTAIRGAANGTNQIYNAIKKNNKEINYNPVPSAVEGF